MTDPEIKRITNLPDNVKPLPHLVVEYVQSYWEETNAPIAQFIFDNAEDYFDEAKEYYSKFFQN